MLQKHRVENRHLQRDITRPVQTVAPQVDQVDRHHIAQIAVVDLHHLPLLHVVRQVVILVLDQEENRSEDTNEKIHNYAGFRNTIHIWNGKWTDCL